MALAPRDLAMLKLIFKFEKRIKNNKDRLWHKLNGREHRRTS